MPNALGLLAEPQMRATPRNKLMGLLADALQGAQDYAQRPDPRMPGGKANPVLGLLADAASLQSLATTAQRVSYGEPLTNKGKANVPFLKPETADVAMMAPLSPRNALAALGMVGGFGDDAAMRAATVWHGSPHKFNKFDASKIGTGEGAQAYGHGLYFAESPDVAKSYQTSLGDIDMRVDGAAFNADDMTHQAALDVFGSGGDKWKAVKALQEQAQDLLSRGKDWATKAGKEKLARADWIASQKQIPKYQEQSLGSLYKVDLPDDQIARMLDWDKPLSQQPKHIRDFFEPVVAPRRAIEAQSPTAAEAAAWGDLAAPSVYDPTGSEALFAYGKGKGQWAASPEVAEQLRKLGVPGIRYLDGGSRGAGKGSSNFVVFPGNESLLTILERNGQPLR
jgi:hypothetical protein